MILSSPRGRAAMYSHHFNHLQYFPLPMWAYLALLAALGFIAILIQIGLIRYVYARLGIDPMTAVLLLFASLFGSYVNIPILHFPDEIRVVNVRRDFFGIDVVIPEQVDWPGTIIAINLGGAVIPIAISLYLLFKKAIWVPAIIATAAVSAICYAVAQPVAGAGIVIPIFIPPIVACAVSCFLSWNNAPALAYISGSLGTLIGADLLNLGNIRNLGAPIASIGGAGTFDGIFVTGIFAVLLASLIGGLTHRSMDPGPA
jgi:uncharacterized membrane protein